MKTPDLIKRLHTIRRMVRRRLIGYGFCATLAAGIISFMTALTFDWLLELPAVLRIAVAMAFLGGLFASTIHWIVRPVRARLEVAEIAGQLERHFKRLEDRLSSTVNFLQGQPADVAARGSASMMQQVISNTDRAIREIPLESALTLRPLVARGVLLMLSMGVLAVVLLASPGWARTGFYRYVYPFGEFEWPRSVSITPLTGTQTVALGESVTLSMQITRGLHDTLRGVVHLRDRQGGTVSLAMQRGPEGILHTTIDTVTEDLDYWFEAGDASTIKQPFRIRVVRRVEVVEALATIEPPPYAPGHSLRTQDLSERPVSAVIGSFITINVRASKSIPLDPDNPAALLRLATTQATRQDAIADAQSPVGADDNTEPNELQMQVTPFIPLIVDAEDPHRLSSRFEITGDMEFRIELRDQNGFMNRRAALYSILAVPDRAPAVTIVEPRAVIEVTPNATVDLVIQVEDDFGVARLDLIGERDSTRPAATGELRTVIPTQPEGVPLTTASPADEPMFSTSLTDRLKAVKRVQEDETARGVAEYSWNLAPLALLPGDLIVYHAVAADTFPGELSEHTGSSAPMRMRIISDLEFDGRVRDELAILEERMRQLALDETELLDGTSSIVQGDGETAELTQEQQERLGDLSMRQGRMIRRADFLAERFSDLVARMEQNLAGDEDGRRRIADVGTVLRELTTGPMTRATGALTDASRRASSTDGPPTAQPDQATSAETQQALVRDARREQEIVIAALQRLLRSMSQWGNFQWLVSNARDLLDRQEALRRQTLVLGKPILGRELESLTPQQAEDLKRSQRRQEQLSGDVDDLLAQMARLHGNAKDKPTDEQTDAEAIDAALRAARAGNIAKRLRTAAAAIGLNRTAAAAIEQHAAAGTLRRMIAALRERERRELVSLRKRLESAEEQIAALIEEQTALRLATDEAASGAADDAELAPLEQEQYRIKGNTRSAAESITTSRLLADNEAAARASRTIRLAEDEMAKALKRLQEKNPADTLVAQDEALELLEDALAQLEELAQLTAEQELRRTLEQIREDLLAIQNAQRDVNEGIRKLKETVDTRGVVQRSESREAAKLARQQSEVRTTLDEVLPDLRKVPVYEWALRRVAEWMDKCRNRLDTRKVDSDLVATSERIVRELDRLVHAIDQTKSLPISTEFAEAGGGGSGGRSTDAKPVPTVAELLVLKAMQADINLRTTELNRVVDVDAATEEQLRELRIVGEDQSQVRLLTDLVTKRARHP